MKSKYPLIKEQFEDIKYLIKVEGYSEKDLIEVLGIHKSTFYKYKKEHSDFADLLKDNQSALLSRIEEGLFKRAMGYDHEETSIEIITDGDNQVINKKVKKVKKHLPPNMTAIIFALKRLSPYWRQMPEVEEAPLNIDDISDTQSLEDLLNQELEDPFEDEV